MNIDTNQALPESDINEWKWSWRDEYMKWMSAFARTNGGTLYIGVNDDGYVVGLKDWRKLQEDLPNKFRDKLHISPTVRLHFATERGVNIRYPDGVPTEIASKDLNRYASGTFTATTERDKKKLAKWEEETPICQDPDGRYYYLEIDVEHYPDLVTYEGVQYTRSGSTLQRLEGLDLQRTILQIAGKKWDSFGTRVKVDDLDEAAIKLFKRKAVEKGRLSAEAAGMNNRLFIKNLDLITEDGELKRAGAMMFGDPEKVATGAYIKVAYFAPVGTRGMNTANDIIYHDDVHGPLALQADRVIDLLYSKYLKGLVDYAGLQRTETYMLTKDILREVFLNAIMHKNYESGNPIQVRVYDDHISVMNEGLWPFDVLPVEDAYKPEHESYQYNPKIAELFYKTGEVETFGTGFEKISLACERINAPLPEIKASNRSVKLVCNACEEYMRLWRYGQHGEVGADGIWRKQEEKTSSRQEAYIRMQDVLSRELKDSERKKMISLVTYFAEHDEISAADAAKLIGKSVPTATRYLGRMIELGTIEKIGMTNGVVYRLAGLGK